VSELPDVTSPRVLRELFKEQQLSPRRQWGQNFLIDANVARKIKAALEAVPGRAAIEVGPGAGALTLLLDQDNYQILALEIDRGLVRLLNELFAGRSGVTIQQADALKVNWRELMGDHFSSGTEVKLISNLPYVISGPFLFSILKEHFPFQAAVLMLQKEVARRLVASPGDPDYGALTVLCCYYTEGKVLFDVSNSVFWPKPKVGSAVLLLKPRSRILPPDQEPLLWTIVQGVFQQRRKTIFNNLGRLRPDLRDQLPALLVGAGIDPVSRPEEIGVEQFAKLSRIIYNIHQ
jgi:16S rRNA (adenine1518-N6/adenine1519-N6)-dimethyltransferase